MFVYKAFNRRAAEPQSSIRQKVKVKRQNLGFLPVASLSVPLRLCGLIILLAIAIVAQVPSPKSVLGFNPTDDKTIVDWKQITDYFAKLDKASPKVLVKEIGKSTLVKPLIVAFISSPENIHNL